MPIVDIHSLSVWNKKHNSSIAGRTSSFTFVPTTNHVSLFLTSSCTNAFVTVQVYGFSWIVLLVMVLLFKVYHVNCLGFHIFHVFRSYGWTLSYVFVLVSALHCNSKEINCLADFCSVSAGPPCSWNYCRNCATYCIHPLHYCWFICECTCFYSNWLVCFMCKYYHILISAT